jgi:hypothetical protein
MTHPNDAMVHEVRFEVHIRAQAAEPRRNREREQDQHQSFEVYLDKEG